MTFPKFNMKFFTNDTYSEITKNRFLLPLGENDDGQLAFGDFFEMQHILIGGDSEKFNAYLIYLINFLSKKYSSEELKFVINTHDKNIFSRFESLPHLQNGIVNSTIPDILNAGQFVYSLYRNRQDLLERTHIDFFGYNRQGIGKKLPLIVSITCDYSKLASKSKNEFLIYNLASKAFYAKNTGVFLIVATSNYAIESSAKELFDSYFPTRLTFFRKIRNRKSSILIGSNSDSFPSENQVAVQHTDKQNKQTLIKLKTNSS